MLSHNFPFDTVQMPLNCFDATYHSFETKVLPELTRRGIAPLGMKSLVEAAKWSLRAPSELKTPCNMP